MLTAIDPVRRSSSVEPAPGFSRSEDHDRESRSFVQVEVAGHHRFGGGLVRQGDEVVVVRVAKHMGHPLWVIEHLAERFDLGDVVVALFEREEAAEPITTKTSANSASKPGPVLAKLATCPRVLPPSMHRKPCHPRVPC